MTRLPADAKRSHSWVPRHRRTRRARVVPVLSAVTVVVGVAAMALPMMHHGEGPAGSPATSTGPMAFGVLGSDCKPGRAVALHESGVSFAELGVDWRRFEPSQGFFDDSYVSQLKRALAACRSNGLGVVLTLGLNSAPRWVSDLTAGTYVNQYGDRGSDAVPDVVFSGAVRGAVRGYLAELNRVVHLNSLAAIRVGTGNNGELGYPATEGGRSNAFWAFGAAAQEGTGLAKGMSASPMPGWIPGSTTWRNASVTTAEVRAWFDWYSNSLADFVVWAVRQLRGLGYTHDVHLPLAGRGALPSDLHKALEAHLDGTGQPDGSIPAGLYYPEQLREISMLLSRSERRWGRVFVDSTSVDDSSAVSARQHDPPQAQCHFDDSTSDLVSNPDVAEWPSFRWTVANARAAGFGVVGENPGPPGAPGTGSNDQTDSSAQQMNYAPRYARECGMRLFQWAFEDDLFSNHGALLRAYAKRVQALNSGARRTVGSSSGNGGL